MQCYRRSMRISYTQHVSSDSVLDRAGQQRLLLGRVKSRQLKYFGHVARHPGLDHDIMFGPVSGTRRQGGQRRQWFDDVKEWTGCSLPELVRLAEDRSRYRKLVHTITYARQRVSHTP